MKKALIFGLAAALALGLGMMPAAAEAKYKVKIGGGPTGGTFNTFANGAAVCAADCGCHRSPGAP